ncbi:type II secretion system F family protein [Bradyrhizobium erythrophlei]|uniref:type II secretion system F family protein n=1 Tax=Bradyrhizobium erythrophlei TaxID=1437360 RepID=UPI0035E614C2
MAFVLGQNLATRARVRSRIVAPLRATDTSRGSVLGWNFDHLVENYFDEKKFGVEGSIRAKLRRDLVRAAFFNPNALNYYIFARLASVVVITGSAYVLVAMLMAEYSWPIKFLVVAVAMAVAVLGPDAFISRRQRIMQDHYRLDFPDFLDLIVVCIDAGLSLEAAVDRVAPQVTDQNRALGTNLMLLGAEVRAGRTTMDALDSLADRLGIDEARSFSGMLRQSIELGTDVGDALRVFGDEMRDRRLLRAEERANQLPVKMVLPLGMFIFPVILMTVLVPAMLRLLSVMQ